MIWDGGEPELPSTAMLSTMGGRAACGSWAASAAGLPQQESHGGAERDGNAASALGERSGAPAPGGGRRRRPSGPWVPVSARKASRSPSGATSTSISSPAAELAQ